MRDTIETLLRPSLAEPRLGAPRLTVFYIVFVFGYLIFLLLKIPSWLLAGNFWDEAATNYYASAVNLPWWQGMLKPDAGYFAFPPRLIALVADALQVPAAAVPYLYTFTAAILSAMLVGVFILPRFRVIIASDSLRIVTSIAALVVVEFMTRGFVNFSYFGAFTIAVILIYVITRRSSAHIAWWFWLIPVFMLAKPVFLVFLPIIFLAAWLGPRRFVWVAVVSFVTATAQLGRMVVSMNSGQATAYSGDQRSLPEGALIAVEHAFGLIGAGILGPNTSVGLPVAIVLGIVVATLLLFSAARLRFRIPQLNLSVLGVYLIGANAALGALTIPLVWTADLVRIAQLIQDRHSIVGYFGLIFTMAASFSLVSRLLPLRVSKLFNTYQLATVLFVVWFVASGWLARGLAISTVPAFPMTGSGAWQAWAPAIDEGESPICVPVDPFGIVFGVNCQSLVPEFNSVTPVAFKGAATSSFEVSAIPEAQDRQLISFAVPIKSVNSNNVVVTATGAAITGTGTVKLHGQGAISTGNLLQLTLEKPLLLSDILRLELDLSTPAQLGYTSGDSERLAIIWMGN